MSPPRMRLATRITRPSRTAPATTSPAHDEPAEGDDGDQREQRDEERHAAVPRALRVGHPVLGGPRGASA